MTRRLSPFFLLGLALLGGCLVSAEVPAGVVIQCSEETGCAQGLVCAVAASRCVEEALQDETGPRLLSATALESDRVRLVFDEEIVVGASALSNTAITPSLEVTGLAPVDDEPALLDVFTTTQRGQRLYELIASDISDIFGNPLASEARQTRFEGFGQGPDGSPPSFIAPDDGTQFAVGMVDVSWGSLALVEQYELEVWTEDPSLTDASGPDDVFTVRAPSAEVSIALTEATTHWLRLRSDATRDGEYAVRRIEAIDDTVYVYCPMDAPCTETGTGGNLANPRRTVTQALADARRLGATRVLVAARGGGQAYEETIDVFANLTLRGGYDASFDEAAWDPALNATIISTSESTVLACDSVDTGVSARPTALECPHAEPAAPVDPTPVVAARPVLVEGLELVIDAASTTPSNVVSFQNCDDGLELRGNILRNEGSNPSRTGVFMQSAKPDGSPGPRIISNTIESGLGIQILGVDSRIEGNVINGGGIPEAGGVFITGGNSVLCNNSIDVSFNETGGFVAVYVLQLNPFNGRADVIGNAITVANGPRASVGVILVNADGDILRNSITTGASPTTYGILLQSSEVISERRQWRVEDNDVFAGLGACVNADGEIDGSEPCGFAQSFAFFVGDRGDPVDATFARNLGKTAGMRASSGQAAGLYIGAQTARGNPALESTYDIQNNALTVGCLEVDCTEGCSAGEPDCHLNGLRAGGMVFLVGLPLPEIDWIHNTVHIAEPSRLDANSSNGFRVYGPNNPKNEGRIRYLNNLIIGPGALPASPPRPLELGSGFYSQESNGSGDLAGYGTLRRHNIVVSYDRFARFAPPGTVPLDVATGTEAVAEGLGEGNLGLEDASLDTQDDLALTGFDALNGGLIPTASSPGPLLRGAPYIDTAAVDVSGAERTCPSPTECVSIGAYEVD